jgi:hypothetical protein
MIAILRPTGVGGNEAVRCPGGEVGTTMQSERVTVDGMGACVRAATYAHHRAAHAGTLDRHARREQAPDMGIDA